MIGAARRTAPLPGPITIFCMNDPKVATSALGKADTNLLKLHRVGEWAAP